MSFYRYERDGEVVEREYPIGAAPQSVRIKGRVFKRVLEAPVVVMAGNVNGRPTSFVSYALGDRFNRFHRGEFVRGEDGIRRPAFSSQREVEDLKRRASDSGVKLGYGAVRDGRSARPARS